MGVAAATRAATGTAGLIGSTEAAESMGVSAEGAGEASGAGVAPTDKTGARERAEGTPSRGAAGIRAGAELP